MAVFTTAGLNLIATAVQTPGAIAGVSYVGISAGCGRLSSGLTSGNVYTQLAMTSGDFVGVTVGMSLIITDGTHSQTVTCNHNGLPSDGVIFVNSFTASHTFAAVTTAVVPAQSANDTALHMEQWRVAVDSTAAGGNPGESLVGGYFDGTQFTGLFISVGYFGGSGATSDAGTGILIAQDIQYWNHTQNADSAIYQLDCTI